MPRALLLAAPVGAGKSSALARLAARLRPRVHGVVAHGLPRPAGAKAYEIEFLPSGARASLEACESTRDVVSTCRFRFDGDVLKRETEHIINSMFPCPSSEREREEEKEEWVFIDEIGPIELRQKKGLWTVLESVPRSRRNVLIVVRSDLEEEVKEVLLSYDPLLKVETFHLSEMKEPDDLLKALVGKTEKWNQV